MPVKKSTPDLDKSPEVPEEGALVSGSGEKGEPASPLPESGFVARPARPFNRIWLVIGLSVLGGLLLGYLLSFLLMVKPAREQLAVTSVTQVDGELSANQIKSDLSNTRLRQQEMEIRYLTAAARLESANQYILLLRMENCVTTAHLLVEQKKGLEARKALADLRSLFDQLSPYINKKDAGASDTLDSLIQTAVQDLTSDPETARSDLDAIRDYLKKVETTLFHME